MVSPSNPAESVPGGEANQGGSDRSRSYGRAVADRRAHHQRLWIPVPHRRPQLRRRGSRTCPRSPSIVRAHQSETPRLVDSTLPPATTRPSQLHVPEERTRSLHMTLVITTVDDVSRCMASYLSCDHLLWESKRPTMDATTMNPRVGVATTIMRVRATAGIPKRIAQPPTSAHPNQRIR